MKKTLSVIIALVMLLSVLPLSIMAASANPFTDVPEGAYYYDAVLWAYRSGITTGVSATRFAPSSTTTRGQVVTFLWRALGEPEPKSTENPFEDVKPSDYFYKAVLWAVEEGITNGTSAKRFSPAVTCTNAHILTFIWRAMGEPSKTGNGEWYEDAVNWAANAGMLDGTFEGTFDPKGQCPRANVVTYLYKYDETASDILRVFVSTSGNDATADGTATKPFATITAARDYVRTVSKDKYSQIIIRIGAGEYQIKEPITLTKADSGTETCEIKYIAENGTTVIGGVKLTAADFTKASGGLTKYFPEEARDNIVMVDLTKYGFTAEEIKDSIHQKYKIATSVPFLSLNGERQTIAEFPNDSYIHVGETVTHSADGTTNTARDGIDLQTINYGEEYMERVLSWSNVEDIYVIARLFKLWCPDDSKVVARSKTEPTIDILFAGGHEPEEGTILKFYNIPEELDVPGEYILDDNGILYYYPAEGFDTGILTVPVSDGLLTVNGAKYITVSGITFTSSNGDGIVVKSDNVSIIGCDISSIKDSGVRLVGNNLVLRDSSVSNIGDDAVRFEAGDIKTITGGNILIYNNDIFEYSVTGAYGYGISGGGVDILIAHNDVHDANFKGIHVAGAVNAVIEYNECWNVSRLSEDVGVLSADSKDNANVIFRYNYVHDCMPQGEAAKIQEANPNYGYYGTFGIYYDNGCSYIETYGNVVSNVDNGYLSNGGRMNSTHGNLFMDCHMWYVSYSAFMYAPKIDDNGNISGSSGLDEYLRSPAWAKINPDVAALITDYSNVDAKNEMLECAPAKNSCYNNWIVYNKADRQFTNWGIRPYNIEDYVKAFCGDAMKADESLMTTYSSKRSSVDVRDIIAGDAAGTIEITLEQFDSIGRIG